MPANNPYAKMEVGVGVIACFYIFTTFLVALKVPGATDQMIYIYAVLKRDISA